MRQSERSIVTNSAMKRLFFADLQAIKKLCHDKAKPTSPLKQRPKAIDRDYVMQNVRNTLIPMCVHLHFYGRLFECLMCASNRKLFLLQVIETYARKVLVYFIFHEELQKLYEKRSHWELWRATKISSRFYVKSLRIELIRTLSRTKNLELVLKVQ